MNRARVAALLRELASEIDPDSDEADDRPSRPRPRPKRVRRAPALVRPEGTADPSVQAQADRILRARGFR